MTGLCRGLLALVLATIFCTSHADPAIGRTGAPADAGAARQPDAAKRIIEAALAAQGGEEKLRALRSVRWRATGYRSAVEQSERPEGPYLIEMLEVSELHVPGENRIRSLTTYTLPSVAKYSLGLLADATTALRITDAGQSPGDANLLRVATETIALSPERLLVTAADSADLTLEKSAMLQGVAQDVVRFTLHGALCRIFLNRNTHLPTAFDYEGPLARVGYWRYLGDVRMRTLFGFWWLTPSGIRMPLQRDVFRNGLPDTTLVVAELALDGPVQPSELTISDDQRKRYGAVTAGPPSDLGAAGVELAPGITLIPGPWNVSVVEQRDGFVVIEAPISSAHTAQVIEWIGKRYPGRPIKGVISTSDSWPHVAGIREYAARGIPIYCLDLNVPLLRRILGNPHMSDPDRLRTAPRRAEFRPLSDRLVLGTGANRMEIYPIRGETSERQLMVYFPERRLLYGSDPFQKTPDGRYFHPQTVSELVQAVARVRLRPREFYMMHLGPTAWEEAVAAAGPTGAE